MKKWICLALTVLLLGTLALPVCAEEVGETQHSHTWDGGTVTTKATCVAAGVKTYTCTVCGAERIEGEPRQPSSFPWGVILLVLVICILAAAVALIFLLRPKKGKYGR